MVAPDSNSGKPSYASPLPALDDYRIAIDAEGVWHHDGRPIRRPELVKLFARVLRRMADGSHWLVTPYERGPITVVDAPFLAVAVERVGPGAGPGAGVGPETMSSLIFTTNLGESVTAGPGHDIHVTTDTTNGHIRPYIHVRDGLMARLTRPVYYALADLAESGSGPGPEQAEPGEVWGVWSRGIFYRLA